MVLVRRKASKKSAHEDMIGQLLRDEFIRCSTTSHIVFALRLDVKVLTLVKEIAILLGGG